MISNIDLSFLLAFFTVEEIEALRDDLRRQLAER
jgi:hypothetical protein